MFDIKNHHKAHSIREAIELLEAHPKARLIAGGTDILVKLHKGKPGFEQLVDIHDLPELDLIKMEENGDLIIGAGCSFTRVAQDPLILAHIPVLSEAVSTIGGPQVRNMATIGGNLCNGVPSADSAPSLLALNAVLMVQGPRGERLLPLADFFLGPGKISLEHSEIVTAITVSPKDYKGYAGHYYKYAMRLAMDIATIGCAAVCRIENNVLKDLRLAYGVAAPVPIRCPKTEAKAEGQTIDEHLLKQISTWVVEDVRPRTSWRASKELRLQVIQTLAQRVVARAISQAGGTIQ